MVSPVISVLGAGAMGSKLALKMHASGAGHILTHLEGRSPATARRAKESGMVAASYSEIVSKANFILSVVPPSEARPVAVAVLEAYKALSTDGNRALTFADCNAVNTESAKEISGLFRGTNITFVDGSVIGLPPSETYNPGIFVSADPEDEKAFDEFVAATLKYGLNVFPMKGEGASVGDASSLKMAHSAIVKGTLGLIATSVLAANASSPATAKGLVHALEISQPPFVDVSGNILGLMPEKAYRFIHEMEEVSGFIGGAEGTGTSKIYEGMQEIFARMAKAHEAHKKDPGSPEAVDAEAILRFAAESAKTMKERTS